MLAPLPLHGMAYVQERRATRCRPILEEVVRPHWPGALINEEPQMNQEHSNSFKKEPDSERHKQVVYVLMSENDAGVAGLVCGTRQRAENELRAILSEYLTHDVTGRRPSFSAEAIELFVEEVRQASICPCQDDRYWIDECPVHH